jgi:hypothetical protein
MHFTQVKKWCRSFVCRRGVQFFRQAAQVS